MTKFLEPCRQEFQLRNCGFGNAPPDEMVRSQWQSRTKNVCYLLYRCAVAIFYIVTVGISMSHIQTWQSFGLYLIYLTNWGILLCMSTAVFGAVLVAVWYFHPEYSDKIQSANKMPFSFKFYWAMHNATMTLSFVITIIYWGILHNSSSSLDATNVLTHGFNSAIMFLDVLLVAHPIRLYHVYQPLTIGLVFLLFSLVYYAAGAVDREGNHFIYFVLDWSKPEGALITACGTVGLAIVMHTALFAVQKLRVFVHDKCAGKQLSGDQMPVGGGGGGGGGVGGGQTTSSTSLSTNGSLSRSTHISMVLGSGYSNDGFKGSSLNVV